MKTVHSRWFTYEDVRKALEGYYHLESLPGINVGGETGYIVVECPKEQQPPEPKEKDLTLEDVIKAAQSGEESHSA